MCSSDWASLCDQVSSPFEVHRPRFVDPLHDHLYTQGKSHLNTHHRRLSEETSTIFVDTVSPTSESRHKSLLTTWIPNHSIHLVDVIGLLLLNNVSEVYHLERLRFLNWWKDGGIHLDCDSARIPLKQLH